MITIYDKISSFKKIIHDDIEKRLSEDINKEQEESDDIVKKYRKKKDKDIEMLKRKYALKLEQKKDKISSGVQKEGQDILLSTNKEIYNDFFKSLNDEIRKKYEGELGEKYIENMLKEAKADIKKDDIICLFANTFNRDKKIVIEIIGDVEIQISNNIKIGGFEVENKERTYRNNYSLDSLIKSNYTKILTQLKKELEMTV